MQAQKDLIMPGMKFPRAVALSYFHPKEGPIVVFFYPRETMTDDLLRRVSEIMDNAFGEGFYTHSFGNFFLVDYYFQIPSDWARGGKEMVMMTTIFDEKIPPDLDYAIHPLSVDFSLILKKTEEVFKGFYLQDEKYYPPEERAIIRKMDAFLLEKTEEFFHQTNEKIAEKVFEKQLGSLVLFTEDDAGPIRWVIGEVGVKILLAILRGARTRHEIANQTHLPLEEIAQHMPGILSLDLATEGLEIVLTNRGLKFLGLVGTEYDQKYDLFERNSFQLIFNIELVKILIAVGKGAKTAEDVAELSGISVVVVMRRLPTALNFDLITRGSRFDLADRGKRFLNYAQTCTEPDVAREIARLDLDVNAKNLYNGFEI